ncbi:MAG: hypothetical protein RRB13_15545 [bacterium]|nr:hypothetical protein [bacterium]
MNDFQISVIPAQQVQYGNEYRLAMGQASFVETIRIDPATCVYTRWSTTQYQTSKAGHG